MIIFIATIILTSSFLGMGVILFRKIPILVELPKVPERVKRENLISSFKKKIQESRLFKNFSYETFLQKLLSKIKILTMKTENKTSTLLQELRKKSKKKKVEEADNYWEELKKSTNQKDREKKFDERKP